MEKATRLVSRGVVRLNADDADENVAAFLQGLVTNDVVKDVLPVYAGLLSPQGKVLFDFLVWPDDKEERSASLLLDCEASAAPELVKRLQLYRLRRRIRINIEPALAVHWTAETGLAPDHAVSDPRLVSLGKRWLAPLPIKADFRTGNTDTPVADAKYLAHRLTQGVCEGRAELGHGEILWLETNAAELHGVSFVKGCYVGQENTARMNWRQKVNRRLVVVPEGESLPERRRCHWPELGLALDHRRIEDIPQGLLPA